MTLGLASPRYALHLVDTVQVAGEKAVCLTSGVKSIKDTMFFLNQEVDKDAKPAKKAPAAKLAANGSPVKNKTAGGKVLRSKTRSAAQEELIQTTVHKISDHQHELHAKLQSEGLEKYSESGGGAAGKEGKSWKRFQSYKGEAALPREIEHLRVSGCLCSSVRGPRAHPRSHRSMWIGSLKRLSFQCMASLCRSISIPSRT